MADDEDGEDIALRRIPSDQLAVLVAALERGRAREVVPDRPPAYATGEDARTLRKVAERVVDEKGISEDRVATIINDTLERFYDRRIRPIEEKMADFVPSSGIDAKINKTLKSAGLNVDEDHIEATADAMRGVQRWQKRMDKVIGGAALSVLGAAFYAIMRLIGVNLPLPGSHQ